MFWTLKTFKTKIAWLPSDRPGLIDSGQCLLLSRSACLATWRREGSRSRIQVISFTLQSGVSSLAYMEELLSLSFMGLSKIRLLLQDRMRPKIKLGIIPAFTLFTTSAKRIGSNGFACRIFKWISPFEDRKYLSKNKSLWAKVTNLTIHINGNNGVLLKL